MTPPTDSRPRLFTVGYERATPASLIAALRAASVDLLVDVRAVASSRRPGFAKTRLAGHLAGVGIGYLHLRGLGTPAEGRAAARSGDHDELRRIYLDHLATPAADADLATLIDLLAAGRSICLLCLEADPAHCHRQFVAAEIHERTGMAVVDLDPTPAED